MPHRVRQEGSVSAGWSRQNSVAAGAAIAALAIAGVGHRVFAAKIDALLSEYLRPKREFRLLPLQVGNWRGTEIELDESVRKIAGDDEFINRDYRDEATGRAASVYIGYIGRPRSRMGHRPDVCYRTHGFTEVSREAMEIPLAGEAPLPVLLHEFAPPGLGGQRQLVIATFSVNGHWVNDTATANRYNVRGPAVFSRQLAYVVRVQVSTNATGDRQSDLQALSRLTGQIIGQVRELLPE